MASPTSSSSERYGANSAATRRNESRGPDPRAGRENLPRCMPSITIVQFDRRRALSAVTSWKNGQGALPLPDATRTDDARRSGSGDAGYREAGYREARGEGQAERSPIPSPRARLT